MAVVATAQEMDAMTAAKANLASIAPKNH